MVFSDRPERITGTVSTDALIDEVFAPVNGSNENSFYVDPPNAAFSSMDSSGVGQSCELYMYVYACAHVCCVYISIALCGQDPPNGALECKVDGVARTTVVTITTPVLMTDESGVVTLKSDAALVRMTRGGPTAANMTAATEDVADEVFVCDNTSSVSLFIDDAPGGCPSPMTSCPSLGYIGVLPPDPDKPPKQVCFPGASGATLTCATGFTLETGLPPQRNPYCASY